MAYLNEYRQSELAGAERIGPIQLVQAAPQPIDERSVVVPWLIVIALGTLITLAFYVWPAFAVRKRPGHKAARILGQIGRVLWYGGAGFIGLILAILWFYAEQDSLDNNINLLAYPPVLLLWPVFYLIGRGRAWWPRLNLQLHLFFLAWPVLGCFSLNLRSKSRRNALYLAIQN